MCVSVLLFRDIKAYRIFVLSLLLLLLNRTNKWRLFEILVANTEKEEHGKGFTLRP